LTTCPGALISISERTMSNPADRELRAFLTAIIENPDDDVPRLVCADWLAEHGDPHRGELIRVQVELARLEEHDPRPPGIDGSARARQVELARPDQPDPRLTELLARERELLNGNRSWAKDDSLRFAAWDAERLPSWADQYRAPRDGYRRGFVAEVSATTAAFLKSPGALWRAAPIERLRLENARGRLAALAYVRQLRYLRALVLDHVIGPNEARRLASSPYLEHLTSLNLAGGNIRDEGAVPLLTASSLGRLIHLDLMANELTAATVRALAADPRFDDLVHLDLCNNRIGPEGAAALAEKPWGRLRTLNVAVNQLTVEGIRVLVEVAWLDHLRELDLRSNDIGDEGAGLLADCPRLANLALLDLQDNQLDTPAVEALAACRHLSRLRILNLKNNPISDAGARTLANARHLPCLTWLDLERTSLGPDAGRFLAEAPFLAGLTRLELTYNSLLDEGTAALAASPSLARLTHLNLYGNGIGDAGALALARSPYLGNVTWLWLKGNPIGPEGRRALRQRFGEAALMDGER
jgi:uncharacterized protein (TIGR02996 family)